MSANTMEFLTLDDLVEHVKWNAREPREKLPKPSFSACVCVFCFGLNALKFIKYIRNAQAHSSNEL